MAQYDIITINDKEYYDMTPVMTSNITPVPYIASCSSEYSSGYTAYKAFNDITKDSEDGWVFYTTNVGEWIKLDFSQPTKISALTLTTRNRSDDSLFKDFTVFGSYDDNTYILLKNFTKTDWEAYTSYFFELDATYDYRYYKLVVNDYIKKASWAAIAEIRFLNKKNKFLIKKDNLYYNLENYNEETKSYNAISDFTIDNIDDYSFNINDLFMEITINEETFKPIDKFDNFQLISPNEAQYILNAIKYKRGMSIANGDFSLRIADTIDFFSSESTISTDCSIKIALSTDSGSTWLTTLDNGVTWDILTNTVPVKAYKELTDDEKIQWNDLMDEISTKGISSIDLNKVDFNTLNADKLRFAYVFDINNANDIDTITKLQWQFDSIGTYEQMNNDNDVNISITNNAIKIKPVKDYELMKINVGITSEKSIVEGITYPTREELNNYLDKSTYASTTNTNAVKLADKAKELYVDGQLDGSRKYYGVGNGDNNIIKLRNFPAGTHTEHIDTYTYDNLTKDIPQTIDFVKEIDEVNCFVQVFKQEDEILGLEDTFERYNNDNISLKTNQVVCIDDGLKIKDEYIVDNEIDDNGFYKIDLTDFININKIMEVIE